MQKFPVQREWMALMRNALTLSFEVGGAFSLDADERKKKIDELIMRTGSEKSVAKLRWYEEAGYHTHPLPGNGLFPPSDTDFVTFGQEATRHYRDPARERSNPNQQVSVVFSGNGTYMLYLSGDSLPERLNNIRTQAEAERKIWKPIRDAVNELLHVREFVLLVDDKDRSRLDDPRLFDRTPSWEDELTRTMGFLPEGAVWMVMSSSLAQRGQVPVNVLSHELERTGNEEDRGDFVYRGQKIHWRKYLSQMGAIDRAEVRATLELEFSGPRERVTIRPEELAPYLTIETVGLSASRANEMVRRFVSAYPELERLVREPYRRSLWKTFTERMLNFMARETRLGVSSRFTAPKSFYVDETFDLPVTTIHGQDSSYWIVRSDMSVHHPMHRLLMTAAKQFGIRLKFFPYSPDIVPYLELVPLDRRRPTAARMAIAFGRGGRGQVIAPRRQLMLEPPLAPPPLRTLFVTE